MNNTPSFKKLVRVMQGPRQRGTGWEREGDREREREREIESEFLQ